LRTSLPAILALAVLVLLAAGPALSPGALLNTRGGWDSPFLLRRTQQMAAALSDGHFPVRWMRDANYGFGYPFFNFYAPLSIYLSAGLSLLGLSTVAAIQFAQLGGFAVAAVATYALARRWWEPERQGLSPAGLLAAAAYTLAPFHLVNVYVRGDSLAEFWAMAFYPLTFLAADGLFAGRRRTRAIGLFALSYAGLVLSHNISALIFSPFLGLYLGLRWWTSRDPAEPGQRWPSWQRLGLPVASVLLAMGLSAWFWLPALGERDLAQLEPVTSGYFFYANHFRGADLIQNSLVFDYAVGSDDDPFRVGLAQAIAVLVGLVGLGLARRGRPTPTHALIIAALVVGATFMITPLSRLIWDGLPLLPYTQFPWRFLSVQAFGGALATVGLLGFAKGERGRLTLAGLAIVILLLAARGALKPDHLRLTEADITPLRLAEYEWFTGNIGSTVSAEYLPPWVTPRPWTSAWVAYGERYAARVLSGSADVTPARFATTRQTWLIDAGSAGAELLLPTLYWPGWQARLGEEALSLAPAPGSGLMTVRVPPGEHTLTLKLARTPVRLTGELIALAAALILLRLLWPDNPRRAARRWTTAGLMLLLLAAAARLGPEGPPPETPLTWDFAQLGYLHRAPTAVPFQNGASLAGYSYDGEAVTPGTTMTVDLTWATPADEPARLTLTGPEALRPAPPGGLAPAPLAVTEVPAIGAVSARLAVPADAPPGRYLPVLSFPDAVALTGSALPRGSLALEPVLVRAPSAPLPASSHSLDVQALNGIVSDNALTLWLAWWTDVQLSRNLGVSLRVTDELGNWLAQFDTQPGYGYLPSTLWPAGAWTRDRLALPLGSYSTGAPFAVVAQLYDAQTGEALVTRRLGELAQTGTELRFRDTVPQTQLPNGLTPLDVTFGRDVTVIALRGYSLAQTATTVRLTLAWQALAPIETDFRHFVHLVGAASGAIAVQDDAMPRQNSYPTSQWSSGEIVTETITLNLEAAPPGAYALAVGLYEPDGSASPRLPAVAGGDLVTPDIQEDRVFLPDVLNVVKP
jgi:hypothetical protein